MNGNFIQYLFNVFLQIKFFQNIARRGVIPVLAKRESSASDILNKAIPFPVLEKGERDGLPFFQKIVGGVFGNGKNPNLKNFGLVETGYIFPNFDEGLLGEVIQSCRITGDLV